MQTTPVVSDEQIAAMNVAQSEDKSAEALYGAFSRMIEAGFVSVELAPWFARKNGMPSHLIALILNETQKAYRVKDLSGRDVWIPKSVCRVGRPVEAQQTGPSVPYRKVFDPRGNEDDGPHGRNY